jgi:hypothetical protein
VTVPTSEERLEALLDSPTARALLAEREVEQRARRAELVAERTRLEKRRATQASGLSDAVMAARHRYDQTEAAHEVATREVNGALRAQHAASIEHTNAMARIEHELRATADPAIAALRAEIDDLERRLRAKPKWARVTLKWTPAAALRRAFAGRTEPTDYGPATTALEIVRGLRARTEALSIEALTPDKLAEQLVALRAPLGQINLLPSDDDDDDAVEPEQADVVRSVEL